VHGHCLLHVGSSCSSNCGHSNPSASPADLQRWYTSSSKIGFLSYADGTNPLNKQRGPTIIYRYGKPFACPSPSSPLQRGRAGASLRMPSGRQPAIAKTQRLNIVAASTRTRSTPEGVCGLGRNACKPATTGHSVVTGTPWTFAPTAPGNGHPSAKRHPLYRLTARQPTHQLCKVETPISYPVPPLPRRVALWHLTREVKARHPSLPRRPCRLSSSHPW